MSGPWATQKKFTALPNETIFSSIATENAFSGVRAEGGEVRRIENDPRLGRQLLLGGAVGRIGARHAKQCELCRLAITTSATVFVPSKYLFLSLG